jgi:hypothetical protein
MPWHQQAKKDVIPAKSFEELVKALIRRCPNGETHYAESIVFATEYIGCGSETC